MNAFSALLHLVPFVGPLVAVLLPLLAIAAARRRARRRAMARARSAWPDEPPTGLEGAADGAPRTLIGRLEGRPPIRRFDAGRERALATTAESADGSARGRSTRAADALSLQIDGRRVPLEGPVRVVRGSVERWLGRSLGALDAETAQQLREEIGLSGDDSWRLSTLAEGDRVRAVGVVRAQPGEADGYRDASSRHALAPGEAGAILLAVDGPSRVRLASAGRAWGLGIVGAVGLLALSWGVAEAALKSLPPVEPDAPLSEDPLDEPWVWLAAQSPLHREALANELSRRLATFVPMDRAQAEQRVALEALRSCREGVRAARAHGLLERAEALAASCSPEVRRLVRCDRGRYREAARLASPPYLLSTQLEAWLIAAGEDARPLARTSPDAPRNAVQLLRRLADERSEQAEDPTLARARDLHVALASSFRCAADAIEARAEDAAAHRPPDAPLEGRVGALGRLTEAAQRSPFCALMLADVTEGPARLPLLELAEREESFAAVAFLLRVEASPRAAADRLAAGTLPPIGLPARVPHRRAPHPVLDQAWAAAVEAGGERPRDRALRALLRGMRGVDRVSLGDPEAADPLLEQAGRELDEVLASIGAPTGSGAPVAGAPAGGDASPLDASATEGEAATSGGRGGEDVRAPLDAPPTAGDGASPPAAPSRGEGDPALAERPSWAQPLGRARDALTAWWAIAAAERGALDVAERRVEAIADAEKRRWMRASALARYAGPAFGRGGDELSRAVLTGDGREVARAVVQSPTWPLFLPVGVHRVERNRALLAQHLRWSRSTPSPRCAPSERLRRLSAELRVARALGAEDWQDALEPQVRAHRDAILRREVAVLVHAFDRHWAVYDGR